MEQYEVILRSRTSDYRWSMKFKTSSFAMAESLAQSEGFPDDNEIIAIVKDYGDDDS